MNRFDLFKRWAWSILVVSALAFSLGGCSGDDGRDGADGTDGAAGPAGPAGPTGPAGPQGPGASITPLESCSVCHDDGSYVSAPAAHALGPIELASNVAFAVNGNDLVVSFDLAVDGAPGVGYDTLERGYRQNGTDSAIVLDAFSALTDNGDGSYSFTITDGNLAAGNNRYLFRVSKGGERDTRIYAWGDFPAPAFATPVVGADACTACHGPEGIDVHGGYYAAEDGAEPCLVCHGSPAPWSGQPVASLAEVAHGYHSGIWEEDGVVVEVSYPTYMTNCSVCHAEPAELTAANSMAVSGPACFTCHGSMDGWDFVGPGGEDLSFHLNIADPETADCSVCHDDNTAPATVTGFHNGLTTGRGGIIFDGEDSSLVEGAKFDWLITDVADDGVDLTITWQASYDGVGVDPCNDVVGPGAPVFHAGDGSLRTYRSYAQGDDFIMGTSTSAPGQPTRVNVTVDNTTCAANVATTVIPVEAVAAEKGRIVLGGKPLVVSVLDPAETMQARVPTPTFDWLVGVGGAAPDRRAIVDTSLCLDCHVGSLYQHGGDRVDNVDMCLVCHNSASNEKSVRVGMGVDASEAYDGNSGETFEMKTMLHQIHTAAVPGKPPYVIYRNRGIYAFANDESDVPNWPGTGQQEVFGSDGVVTNHNFHSATYPRAYNDCMACHVAGLPVQPDQTKAMATTVEAGSEVWEDQIDDVLQGATATACVTCHADSASKGHAYQNSWDPQEFPEGRQTIIDAAD